MGWMFLLGASLCAQSTTSQRSKDVASQDDSLCARFEAYMCRYPEAALQDVYKWCFQDVYGPAHLINDSASCADYMSREVAALPDAMPSWSYEYCGPNGNFVRVNLAWVKVGRIPLTLMVSALMRSSAMVSPMPLDEWKCRWQHYQDLLATVNPRPLSFDQNVALLADNFAQGRYAFHHSAHFNSVYNMHYRILHRSIFEREILPLIRE